MYELNGCVGKKPSNKRFVDQTIACFAFKLNCRGSMNGKGCYLCEKNRGNTPMILDKHGLLMIISVLVLSVQVCARNISQDQSSHMCTISVHLKD